MKKFFIQYSIVILIGLLFFAAVVYSANTFPTTLNDWAEGEVIEEDWANKLEYRIGATGSASTTALTYQVNTLMGTTSFPQLNTVGTITTGVWNGTDINVADGGTGRGTFTSSQLLYGNLTSALSSVATSSLTASSPLSLSNPISVIGSSASVLSLSTTGNWSGTFDNQEGSYYLDFTNLTNTGTSTLPQLTAIGSGNSLLTITGRTLMTHASTTNLDVSGYLLANNASSTISNFRSTTGLFDSKVGIGTSTPWGTLSVEMGSQNPAFVVSDQGTTTPLFYVSGNGNIGMGTAMPSVNSKLHIYIPTDTGINAEMRIETAVDGNVFAGFRMIGGATDSNWITATNRSDLGGLKSSLFFRNETQGTKMVIQSTGEIGIGTTSPASLFSINGIANFRTSTTTFSSTGGIDLADGCFAIDGTCVGGSGSSNWTDAGAYLTPLTVSDGIIINAASSTISILRSTLASTTQISASGSLYIPTASNKTVSSTGEIGIDTTSGQLMWNDGNKTQIITGTTTFKFYVSSTTVDSYGQNFRGGTSTYWTSYPEAMTLSSFRCKTNEGTLVVRFGDGTSSTTAMRMTTSGVVISGLTNNTFNAWEDIGIDIGSAVSSPNAVWCTGVLNKTAD